MLEQFLIGVNTDRKEDPVTNQTDEVQILDKRLAEQLPNCLLFLKTICTAEMWLFESGNNDS